MSHERTREDHHRTGAGAAPRGAGAALRTLLLSLQERSERDEADFREEIRSRREAFLSGEMSARPFEDILRERLGE